MNNKLSNSITFKVDPNEKAKLEQLATATGMSISEVMRRLIQNTELVKTESIMPVSFVTLNDDSEK